MYKFCVVCTLFICTKTYKDRFSQLVLQVLYNMYIICMYKKHTKTFSVSQLSRFWIVCTLFLDFYNLCMQNIYKVSVLYNFCIHFVQFLYKFYGKGLFVDSQDNDASYLHNLMDHTLALYVTSQFQSIYQQNGVLMRSTDTY